MPWPKEHGTIKDSEASARLARVRFLERTELRMHLYLKGIGTLAGHRGRGAYRALVMEKCRHAHALGATLALAKANIASSAPILRAAGFRTVARERRYALKMAAPANPRA